MFKLFLPVLFPSWRFFSSIGPSPRIHFAFLENEDTEPSEWIEFRPRPQKIPFIAGLWRLLHNPEWNETLYINTCAEKLFEEYSAMREQEIMRRILRAIHTGEIDIPADKKFIIYKVSAILREEKIISQITTFTSKAQVIKETSDSGGLI